jgi:hypothetical protein
MGRYADRRYRAGDDAERRDEDERRQMTQPVTMQSEAMRRNGVR